MPDLPPINEHINVEYVRLPVQQENGISYMAISKSRALNLGCAKLLTGETLVLFFEHMSEITNRIVSLLYIFSSLFINIQILMEENICFLKYAIEIKTDEINLIEFLRFSPLFSFIDVLLIISKSVASVLTSKPEVYCVYGGAEHIDTTPL